MIFSLCTRGHWVFYPVVAVLFFSKIVFGRGLKLPRLRNLTKKVVHFHRGPRQWCAFIVAFVLTSAHSIRTYPIVPVTTTTTCVSTLGRLTLVDTSLWAKTTGQTLSTTTVLVLFLVLFWERGAFDNPDPNLTKKKTVTKQNTCTNKKHVRKLLLPAISSHMR